MSRYEQKPVRKLSSVLMFLVVVISGVFAIWLYQKTKQDIGKEIKVIDIPIEKPAPNVEKKVQNMDGVIEILDSEQSQYSEIVDELEVKAKLIKLEHSDDSFRRELGNVSESLLYWFSVKNLIRKYSLIINDLSQNQIIYKHRRFLKMSHKMVVKEDSQGLYIGNESYSRYDQLANAIASINVQKGLGLFLAFRPLFKQVYGEFAYPAEYRLEDMFMKAAANVIKAPVIEGRISLLRHSVRYKFADKKLEALSSVDKLMLRMGPENTKKIQVKLRQLVEAISVLNE